MPFCTSKLIGTTVSSTALGINLNSPSNSKAKRKRRSDIYGVIVSGPRSRGAGLVWAWWTDLSFADRRISIGGAVFGAALLLLPIVGVPVVAFSVFRRTNLILGDGCLQRVVGNTRVTLQIPYSNIARIEFLRKSQHDKLDEDSIGIDLHDIDDPMTLCSGLRNSKIFGVGISFLTQMTFAMPLEKICDRIQKRVAR